MNTDLAKRCAAFQGDNLIAAGEIGEVVTAVRKRFKGEVHPPVLIFDDADGAQIDVDFRNRANVRSGPPQGGTEGSRSPGRPKLGVVAREVTLLPRHWAWLAAQPGGASVALRKLVEAARRAGQDDDRKRERRDAAYRFMQAMAGNQPGFEEAARALFAGDLVRLDSFIEGWPKDVRNHAKRLAAADAE